MRRSAFLLFLASIYLIGSAAPAWSHGDVKRSAPGDGAGLTQPPAEVWIEFTEPPTRQARLEVTDPCGATVATGPPVVSGPRVTVPIGASARGEYGARFAIVSRVDGHPSRGILRFAVARGEKCPPVDPNAATPIDDSNEASTATVLLAMGLAAGIGAGGGLILRVLTR